MGVSVLSEQPRSGYRPCVGILLLDRRDQVFVGKRIDSAIDAWQMPQGGIDPGETPYEAGLREMREEIGTDRASLLAESRFWRSYDLPPDLARRMWGGKYRGQTQRWLAFRFEGDDAEIAIEIADAEFQAWRWVAPEDLPGLIVPFKRDVYLSVVDEFRHLWSGDRPKGG